MRAFIRGFLEIIINGFIVFVITVLLTSWWGPLEEAQDSDLPDIRNYQIEIYYVA